MADTGLRVSEVVGLNVGDVAFGTPTKIRVRRQCYRGTMDRLKTRNARRDVPVSADLARALWPACANREADAPLFATRTGTRVSDTNLRRRVLNPAAHAAGVPWAGFHTLRHTCASRLLAEGGKNIAQVARWLGHADPGFTLRTYVHLMDEGLGDAEWARCRRMATRRQRKAPERARTSRGRQEPKRRVCRQLREWPRTGRNAGAD
jgi:integrase